MKFIILTGLEGSSLLATQSHRGSFKQMTRAMEKLRGQPL